MSYQRAGQQRGGNLAVVADEEPIALPSNGLEVMRRVRRVAQQRPDLPRTHP
jgi:hypothetical protein